MQGATNSGGLMEEEQGSTASIDVSCRKGPGNFVKYHVHEYCNTTKVNDEQRHFFRGTTGMGVKLMGSHIHRY